MAVLKQATGIKLNFPMLLLSGMLWMTLPTSAQTYSHARARQGEDSALLSFVLANQYKGWTKGFIVRRETIPLSEIRGSVSIEQLKQQYPQQETIETLDDFACRNADSAKMPALRWTHSLTYVEQATLDQLPKHRDYWKAFYQKYPRSGGVLSVSLPGYSSDHHTALVYMETRSGGKEGIGKLLLLVKHGEKWWIKETLHQWVS